MSANRVSVRRRHASFGRGALLPAGKASLLAASLAAASIAYGIDDFELSIGAAEGSGWKAQGLVTHFDLSSGEPRARIEIDTVQLAQVPDPIRNIVIECPQLEISREAFACRNARVLANLPAMGRQSLRARLRYERTSGALDLDLADVKISTGKAEVHASLREDTWRARLDLEDVSLDALAELARTAKVPLPIESVAGSISLQMHARGRGANVSDIRAQGRVQQLIANNESGSIATDGLTARFDVALARAQDGWRYRANAVAEHGQAYAEPIFVDFGVHALELTARGTFIGTERLSVEEFRLAHAGVLSAQGHGVLLDFTQDQPLRDLEVEIEALQFPGAYETYLQPLLLDTDFKSLQMSGAVSGEISIRTGEPYAIRLSLDDVNIEDDQASLALRGVQGLFDWSARREGDRPRSKLAWSGGAFYGLELGESTLEFATVGSDFELLAPTRIPLLDGALQLDALAVQRAGSEQLAFRVDASLEPISVARLCKAFGWPQFGGRVSGAISNLQLDEGVLTLGTTLEAQVFDGLVTVKDLRLDEPFGNWPRLYATIDLHELDLELVTSAFSFGRITGRLSGGIHDLELFNWSPVAFDARLLTPENDRSRHRISQRAVQNIGSIGGGGAGVTAALSSGFLRFFDDFNYARLGITCKLTNEVCEMGGVGPAPNGGYYLVQGRGLPRIDVIGNARRVDWPRLVQQLIAATESAGPIVD